MANRRNNFKEVINDKFAERKYQKLSFLLSRFKLQGNILVNGKFIKSRYCKIFVRKSFTNFFITMTDIKNRVILTLSLGLTSKSNNRKKKLSYDNFLQLINRLLRRLKFLKINYVSVVLRSNMNWQILMLFNELNRNNIFIFKTLKRILVAHNGVYNRHTRRI